MNILFITNSLAMGGVETNIIRLTGALTRRGHEVTVASAGGTLEDRLMAAGGTHVRVAMDLRSPARTRRDLRTLDVLIGERRPDVIHVFSASGAVLVGTLKVLRSGRRRTVPPVVSTIMGLASSPDERSVVTYARAWATSVGADCLLVISPAIAQMVRGLPIRRARVRAASVVGIEIETARSDDGELRSLREALLAEGGSRLVLTAGNLEPRKSHDLFIAAAAGVAREHPGARFVIVGEGSLRADLEAMIDRLGLVGIVSLAGERADLDDLLACADVYVRPGIVEGFIGITVLQAQAARVPVVSFDTKDVRMAISHSRTGWLVAPGDVHGLTQTLLRLLGPAAETAAVVEVAHRQAIERFNVEAVSESLLALYREMTGAPECAA